MLLTYKNKQLEVLDGAFVYDLDSYYYTIRVQLLHTIPTFSIVKLHDLDCVVIGSEYSDNIIFINLITKKQFDVIKRVSEPICGKFNTQGLLSELGYKYHLTNDTNLINWILPSLSFKSLIDSISDYTVPSSGGVFRFVLDFNGDICGFDLKQCFLNKKSKYIDPKVSTEYNDAEWILNTPGNLNLYSASIEGIKSSSISIQENLNSAKIFCNDTTGMGVDLVKQRYLNNFNFQVYTADKVEIEACLPYRFSLGDKVIIENVKSFIISSIVDPIPLDKSDLKYSKLKLVCPL